MNNQTHNCTAIRKRINRDHTGRVTARFRDYTIASAFQPIYSLSHPNPVGYEALCRATTADGSALSPLALFGQVNDESDNVLLDRLSRALHIQNFSRFSDKSWIFLNVNPLVTVVGKNYGAFFREMLAHNHISTSQVVIEILEQNIQDESILPSAVNYYKELGCLVAIDDFGASHSNFDRIWNIQPDMVKLDRSIIVQAETNSVVRKALPSMVGLIQELGCIALIEGVETKQQALIAIDSNADLVQGYYFGYPRTELVDVHDKASVLPQLCDIHNEYAASIRTHYRELIDQCLIEFKNVLNTIKTGSSNHEQACEKLLTLPNVLRIYFLDEAGYQIGNNLSNQSVAGISDARYKPLSDAADANWSRRYYFSQAILNPGEIQISRPYRSLTGKNLCITISELIDTPGGKLVACLDLDWT